MNSPDAQSEPVTNKAKLKAKLEVVKLCLEVTLLVTGLIYILAFTLGAFLMSLFSFRHSFHTGGITAAEGASLALLTLEHLFVLGILLLLGTFASFPIIRLMFACVAKIMRSNNTDYGSALPPRKRLTWRTRGGVLWPVGIVSLAMMLLTAYVRAWQTRVFLLTLLFVGSILCIAFLSTLEETYCSYPREQQKERRSWLEKKMNSLPDAMMRVLFGAFCAVGLLLLIMPELQDTALTVFGIRKNNVQIKLSADDFHQLTKNAMQRNLVINPCEPIQPGANVVDGVDILWHKIGAQALVRFPSAPLLENSAGTFVKIEPTNGSFSVPQGPPVSVHCIELPLELVFQDSNKDVTNIVQILDKAPAWSSALRSHKVNVRIFSDAAEMPAVLLKRRVMALEESLVKTYKLCRDQVSVGGTTDGTLKWDCVKFPLYPEDLCRRSNRRVEIRFE